MNNQEYDQHIINFHSQLLLKIFDPEQQGKYDKKQVPALMKEFIDSFNSTIAKPFLKQKMSETIKLEQFKDYPEQLLANGDISKLKKEFITNKVRKFYFIIATHSDTLKALNKSQDIKQEILNHTKSEIQENIQENIKGISDLFKDILNTSQDSSGEKRDMTQHLASVISWISPYLKDFMEIKDSLEIPMDKMLNDALKDSTSARDYLYITTFISGTWKQIESETIGAQRSPRERRTL